MQPETPATGAADRVELLPCPFCGLQCAELVVNQGDKWGHYEPSCLEVRTGYDVSPDALWYAEAAQVWNRRAALALKPSSGAGVADGSADHRPSAGHAVALTQVERLLDDALITAWSQVPRPKASRSATAARQAVLDAVRATIARQADDLERLRGDGWRPIETAPKDGTVFLSYSIKRQGYLLALFNEEYDEWQEAITGRGLYEYHAYDDRRPTHWRPLPKPPARAQIARPSADQREGADDGGGT